MKNDSDNGGQTPYLELYFEYCEQGAILTDGQWQIVIGIAALIVAIIGIRVGAAVIKRRHVSQRQRTGKGAVSIQSGRDTKVDRIK